jgi:hypothetical protein
MDDPQLAALLGQFGVDPAAVKALVEWSVYLTIAAVIAAIPTGVVAKRKRRSVSGWVIFALCVPVLPLLLVWLLPGRKPPGP